AARGYRTLPRPAHCAQNVHKSCATRPGCAALSRWYSLAFFPPRKDNGHPMVAASLSSLSLIREERRKITGYSVTGNMSLQSQPALLTTACEGIVNLMDHSLT